MLRIFWPNPASTSTRLRAADAVRSHGRALAPLGRAGLLKVALLACVLGLPALPSAAAESTAKRPSAIKVEAKPAVPVQAATPAAAPAPAGPVLQLGIYSRDGDAWLSWKNLQQRERDLTAGLTASVMPLDGKSGAGVALYAQVGKGTDARALCRRIVGAGFGCLVVDRPAVAEKPAEKAATASAAATVTAPSAPAAGGASAIPALAPVMPAASAPATAKPPAVTAAVAPAPMPAPMPAAAPAEAKPPQPAGNRETVTTTTSSVLAPIGSAVAAPLAPPPPSVANATPPVDGLIIYNEEDARTMADIEQHSRRKGRLRSVMPDSRYDVMPATLKRENWNLCALTFDDGPHRTVTRQILDILNQEGVRATYFPVGRIAERQGDLIHDFVAAGHEIGNHSLTHSDLRKMDAAGARYEIAETNRILRSFGANPVLFRPPYGRYSDELLTIARDERMGSVLWSVDTRDWQVRNADKIVSQIKLGGLPGNVFLMHSTYPSTAQALPRVIAELKAKGCEFVTLSEWLERARVLALPKIVNAGMPSPGGDGASDRQ
ncbi:chitooligosaccharide deacetylase [Azospirillum palustre]|uniref:Chitooligosaccharide deacetylase n=1 Tax=Azospirillum palustre TaxID=2044885 RepID=A0A2B8B9T3_9PROT|nr:polysaccharide deacetylase family protein [Azospirillum palustre]PGH54122.1 chitooligosaccharide deacetylase [Azospirillum palustre]